MTSTAASLNSSASSLVPKNWKVHVLKSWVGLYEPIENGSKTHDLRVLDRDYEVGDLCRLYEWDAIKREYTGRECFVQITYITSAQHTPCAASPIALHPAMGILSIRRVEHD